VGRPSSIFLLLSISLDLLRTVSPLRTDQTATTLRSIAADYSITETAATLLQKPP
jgi:hypothetical protein